MGRVTRPAGLADHHVEAQRREIVRIGIDAGVFLLVEDLGVCSAFVASLGARDARVAFNSSERERARTVADDADGAGVISGGRAERAMEIARAGILT